MKKNRKDFIIILLTILVVLSRGTILYGLPEFVYFGWTVFLSIYLFVTNSKTLKIDTKMLFFNVFCALSILANQIDPAFKSGYRFIAFLLVTIPFSPFLYSNKIILFRIYLFKLFMKIISLLVLISFIGYLVKFPLFYHQETGTFSGVMIYCMVLGPIAAVASIYMLNAAVKNKNKIYYLYSFVAFLTCLLSGSRGAFISMFAGFLFSVLVYCKGNFKKMFKVLFVILLIANALGTILSPYMETLEAKQQNNIERGGTFYSREELFKERIEEFLDSPLFGVGFSSIDINKSKHGYNLEKGIVEPGSSWLFILSSTGLITFLLLIIIILSPLLYIYKVANKDDCDIIALGSCLTAFCVHMIIEGYILAAGGFLFCAIWLTIGVCQKNVLKVIEGEKYSIF